MSRRPEKCQNCGYATRYSRQRQDETPFYCANCRAWLCEGCREQIGCEKRGHGVVEQPGISALQTEVPANDGWYTKVSDTIYHSDRVSLSSSGARTLLKETPAEFRAKQDEPPNPKPQYDFGHAAHKMVLGEGSDLVRVDAENWRTKDAQIARNTAWRDGKAPLLKADIDKAQRMAGVVHTNRVAAQLLSEGTPEVSGYWHDDATGVRLRFRPDWLPDRPGRLICVEYKTAVSANPKAFERSLVDYGYHQQAAWCLDGLREVGISDDAGFLFIVQAKTSPFLVSLVQVKPEDIELGRRQNRAAIQLFAECQASGVWPGYGDDIHTVGLPAWAVSQIEASLTDA